MSWMTSCRFGSSTVRAMRLRLGVAALAAVAVCGVAGGARAQGLPPIGSNMFFDFFNFNGTGAVNHYTVLRGGPGGGAGLTSVLLTNTTNTSLVVFVTKENTVSSACTGGNSISGKQLVFTVPASTTIEATFPTPVPVFQDSFGYVCFYTNTTLAGPTTNGLWIHLTGYTS